MKQVNNIVSKTNDLNYKLKISYEEALKDEYFKKLVESINLKDDELMKHTSVLEECKEEYKNCTGCKGLAACKNKMCGYCYLPLVEDGNLTFSYVACK